MDDIETRKSAALNELDSVRDVISDSAYKMFRDAIIKPSPQVPDSEVDEKAFENTSYEAARNWLDFPLGKHDIGYWLDVHIEPIKSALDKAIKHPQREEWRTIDTCPDKTHAFIWWEYDDRSGAGYYAEAFLFDGKWDITGFKEWDYKHKIPTHWKPKSIITSPPKAEK